VDVAPYGLVPEQTVLDGLSAGCDLVAFSGDKLLGGPQAGILAGRADLIGRLKRHPLARAVRADKMALAALSATLGPYLTGRIEEIPVWSMIARSEETLAADAGSWAGRLAKAGIPSSVEPSESYVGGGSLPGTSLPTSVLALSPGRAAAEQLAARLRAESVPIIGRIHDDRLLLDPRTVLPGQADLLLQSVTRQWQATMAGYPDER
jgi:L-seryl-tRNA(Ser) seleniumtransferase